MNTNLERIVLPDMYQALEGVSKKQYAWSYFKKNYPEYDIAKQQPLLYTENALLATRNHERARYIVKERRERQEARKKRGKKK